MDDMAEQTNGIGEQRTDLLEMTTRVVSAYVARSEVGSAQLPELIRMVYSSLRDLGSNVVESQEEPPKPAVPVRKSITPDYIICLEDGKKLKMLKRHLRTMYNMTPEDYRAKWGLPPDYPMVAPNYAKQRSAFAKEIGLGRSTATPAETGRKRGK